MLGCLLIKVLKEIFFLTNILLVLPESATINIFLSSCHSQHLKDLINMTKNAIEVMSTCGISEILHCEDDDDT